jgi:GT2 family glycosyltransferase
MTSFMNSAHPTILSKQFRECLKHQDFDGAHKILRQANDRGYPQILTFSWELELNSYSYPSYHPLDDYQSNQENYLSSSQNLPDFGPAIKEEILAGLLKFYENNSSFTLERLSRLVDLSVSSFNPSTRSVLLPDLTRQDPEDHLISISEFEYLEDNPDIQNAFENGIIYSPIDHLLRNGFLEIMKGSREIRNFSNLMPGKATALLIVSDIDSLSESEINNFFTASNNFADFFILSVKDMKVIDDSFNMISANRFFYQLSSSPKNLCIKLEHISLTDASKKWLSEIKLLNKTAIFGHKYIKENPQYSLCMSRVNALMDDVTNGFIITSALDVLIVINDLKGYSTAQGFYHALILALLDSGVEFLHKHEFLSEGQGIIDNCRAEAKSYWSPFYWSTGLADNSTYSEIRKDLMITWNRHIEKNLSNTPKHNWRNAKFFFKYNFEPARNYDVAIIIPFKDKINLLEDCLESIFNRKEFLRLKVYAVNNDSNLPETREKLILLQNKYPENFACIPVPGPFNFSRINNTAVRNVDEQYILFLNNDILIKSDYAITDLLQAHLFFDAIITGAHLEYPSGKVQHNGLSLSSFSHIAVTSPFKKLQSMSSQFTSSQHQISPWFKTHECSAVTAACMLIKKVDYEIVGGFDENLMIAYNDVDLCLSAKDHFEKRPIICCTDLKIIHLESESRGSDDSVDRIARLTLERNYLVDKHPTRFESNDSFFPVEISEDNVYKLISRNAQPSSPIPASDIDRTTLYVAKQTVKHKSKPIAAIFVHYDKANRVSNECLYYIQSLSKYADIYFVSSSEGLAGNKIDIDRLLDLCSYVLIRKNSGYDFGCWSHVIRENYNELSEYSGLLLCNDSVFGPLHDLSLIFDRLDFNSGIDFWGLTASTSPMWHLQSYFMLYSQKIVKSAIFEEHWLDIGVFKNKVDIIMSYEVGWSDLLLRLGYRGKALFETLTGAQNPTHSSWDKLVELGFPFIKKELIRDNPLRVSLDALPAILDQCSEPWAEYMQAYLTLYEKSNSVIDNYIGVPQ